MKRMLELVVAIGLPLQLFSGCGGDGSPAGSIASGAGGRPANGGSSSQGGGNGPGGASPVGGGEGGSIVGNGGAGGNAVGGNAVGGNAVGGNAAGNAGEGNPAVVIIDDGGLGGSGASGAGANGGDGGGGDGGSDAEGDGCPVVSPEPIAGQLFVIVSVNFATETVTLRNVSGQPQVISSELAWCQRPLCGGVLEGAQLDSLVLQAGDQVAFSVNLGAGLTTAFNAEAGEIAIHLNADAATVADPASLLAYASWGDGLRSGPDSNGRETEAVAAGLWTLGERITIAPGAEGFLVTGSVRQASGYTSVPLNCL